MHINTALIVQPFNNYSTCLKATMEYKSTILSTFFSLLSTLRFQQIFSSYVGEHFKKLSQVLKFQQSLRITFVLF